MADQDISAAEKKVNQLINKQLKAEEEEMRKNPVSKLLLLGPGDSGKTTVLKQMRILHGDGFSATDRVEFQGKVVVNIISSIKAIVSASQALNIALSSQENEVRVWLTDCLAD